MGSEVGRLSNWSRTGVVGCSIFCFQQKWYFSLDKYQCVVLPAYRVNYLQKKYYYFCRKNSEWQNQRWNQSKLLGDFWHCKQYGFRVIPISGVLTITLQSEGEKTTAGMLKTASRALVGTHAHSLSVGISTKIMWNLHTANKYLFRPWSFTLVRLVKLGK